MAEILRAMQTKGALVTARAIEVRGIDVAKNPQLIQSSIGYRYGDPDWAASDPNACEDSPYVCYPPAFGRLGKAIDDAVQARP